MCVIDFVFFRKSCQLIRIGTEKLHKGLHTGFFTERLKLLSCARQSFAINEVIESGDFLLKHNEPG